MRPGDSVQGMALLMVLVFQLVLSLLGTAAFRESGLQQKMVAHAWQGQSDRLIHHRMLTQLEGQWRAGGLVTHTRVELGINARDCALSEWLSNQPTAAVWQPWGAYGKTEYHHLIVEWEPAICQGDMSLGAHTLLMRSRAPRRPDRFIQSLWMRGSVHRSYWRMSD